MSKVIKINDGLYFDDGSSLTSDHDQDCCEHHYLDFNHLDLSDFEGLDFDLSTKGFFEKVPDYGIRLLPVNGHPVSIPGYGYNNGYYGSNIVLILNLPDRVSKKFDVSECQVISD